MSFLSAALSTIKSLVSYTAPVFETPAGYGVNAQCNDQGAQLVSAVVRYAEAYTPADVALPLGPCDCVWVTVADATVTGIMADGTTSYTTPALPKQTWVPDAFKRITAVSSGAVHIGYMRKA